MMPGPISKPSPRFRSTLLISCAACLLFSTVIIVRDANHALRPMLSKIPLLSGIIAHREEVTTSSKFINENHDLPSFKYLANIVSGTQKPEKANFYEYLKYFNRVANFVEPKANAFGMMGYCYFHVDKPRDAIRAYKKAIISNPNFFWFHYNLGVIYFKLGQFDKAAVTLKNATSINSSTVSRFVIASRIYQAIYAKMKNREKTIKQNIRKGYLNSYKLLILSNYHLKNDSEVLLNALEMIQNGVTDPAFFYHYAGRSAYRNKEYQRATLYLTQCVKLNSNDTQAYYYLGRSLQSLGNDKGATQAFQRAKFLENSAAGINLDGHDINLMIF